MLASAQSSYGDTHFLDLACLVTEFHDSPVQSHFCMLKPGALTYAMGRNTDWRHSPLALTNAASILLLKFGAPILLPGPWWLSVAFAKRMKA